MIGRIFVLVATLTWLGSAPAAAGQDHGGGPTVVQEAAVPEGVDDPVDYVRSVYREYMAGGEVADPSFAYSAELRGLIAAAEREARDEPGRLDFDFWASGQDWVIETVDISEQPQSDGRRIIAARFHNQSVPTLIRFHFVRQNGKYFLDDAENVDGPAENRWRLRQILTEPPIVEGGEEWENFYEGADGSIGAFRKPIAMRDGILSAQVRARQPDVVSKSEALFWVEIDCPRKTSRMLRGQLTDSDGKTETRNNPDPSWDPIVPASPGASLHKKFCL